MATKKQKYTIVETEGSFDGMVSPQFKLFNIILKQQENQARELKTDILVSSDKTFSIKIDASQVSKSYIHLLSDELKVAFSLSFAPFNRDEKSYNFYITRYAGEMDVRKKILTGIFDTLEEFEKDYFKKLEQTKPVFEKAKEEIKNFTTDEFDVRFSASLNTFVVVAKAFIGAESFRKLASCAQSLGKMQDNPEISNLFDDNKKYNKKSYFIINQGDYISINEYIRGLKKNNENFLDEQDSFYIKNEKRLRAVEFNEPNLFDYRIKINDERKCFEFYCKGFELPPAWEHVIPKRNLLQIWALNFILSSPLSEMKKEEYVQEYEILDTSFAKEKLNYQKDSSNRDKVFYVPFTEVEKLERIAQNYQKEDAFWDRPSFTVKHACNDFRKNLLNADMEKYPAVYLAGDGQAYFIFESRHSTSRKIDANIINLKGIKITPDEFKNFITNHPFAEQINNNTKVLNAQMWAGSLGVVNYENTEKAYADVAMAYRLKNSSKAIKHTRSLKI